METVESPIQSPAEQPNVPVSPTMSHTAKILGGVWMLALALMLLSCGFLASIFYIVYPLSERTRASMVETNVVTGGMTGLGILLGIAMLWYGVQTLRGRESMTSAHAFPSTLVFVGLYLVAVLIGWLMLSWKPVAVYAFPPWHFIASSAIPFAWLAFAAHRLGVQSGLRALLTSFSWGALGAISMAMILEIVIGLVILVAAVIVIMLLPNSDALINQWSTQVDSVRRTGDFSSMSSLMNDPAIIGVLLVYVAVLVPIAEEAVKALVVAFIDPRRTQLADAILWGLAAGAGFAIVENLFNGTSSLSVWVLMVVLRIGASMMHLGNGALMGRGWYAARVERRWGQLFIAYVISVFLHGVWNAAAVLMSTSVLAQEANLSFSALASAGWVAVALLTVLGLLTMMQLVWIMYAVRSAQSSLQI